MEPLRVEKGAIARVVIQRPEVRNALNTETLRGLRDAFRQLALADEVRVIRLESAGDRAFCAGADLGEVAAAKGLAERRRYFQGVAEVVTAMVKAPQPIVAVVQGHALAGGMGLVAAADFVVASKDARFGLPEVDLGLFPMVVMAPLLRVLPRRILWEMIFLGRRLSAEEAAAYGLIHRAVAPEELDQAAGEVAAALAEKSPAALALGKSALWTVESLSLWESLEPLKDWSALLAGTPEAQEAIGRFLAKGRS
ncbi:MAG: enoyl-CoA hydratase-related protein [Bacillota bacterium]|nr:enoyl-CoA hydratase-related protein [Bacillota bacterium]